MEEELHHQQLQKNDDEGKLRKQVRTLAWYFSFYLDGTPFHVSD